jgi:hypothetical protein
MSAYSKGRDGQVIPLAGHSIANHSSNHGSNHGNPDITGGSQGKSLAEVSGSEGISAEPFQPLPKIGIELEAFLIAAKQNETALLQEKQLSRKYKEEAQEFQVRCTRLQGELENIRREVASWEDRAKSHTSALRQQEKIFQDRVRELNARVEEMLRRENHIRAQAQTDQLECARLRQQVDDLKQKNDSSVSIGRKFEAEVFQLKLDLQKQQRELKRYQAAWVRISEMDQRAKEILGTHEENKQKLSKLDEELGTERRLREKMEELYKKEKRDKEIALSCLQTAEVKMEHLSHELNQLRRGSYGAPIHSEQPAAPFQGSDSEIKLDF